MVEHEDVDNRYNMLIKPPSNSNTNINNKLIETDLPNAVRYE